MDYWRSIADGEADAMRLKGMQDMRQSMTEDSR
jgi:hypothetical protein